MGDVVPAVKLGTFNLDDAMPMNCTTFCQLSVKGNRETTLCQEVRNIAPSIETRWEFSIDVADRLV